MEDISDKLTYEFAVLIQEEKCISKIIVPFMKDIQQYKECIVCNGVKGCQYYDNIALLEDYPKLELQSLYNQLKDKNWRQDPIQTGYSELN